jgi:hypothetical protein
MSQVARKGGGGGARSILVDVHCTVRAEILRWIAGHDDKYNVVRFVTNKPSIAESYV